MVKENRIVFSLEDILRIRFRCSGCGNEIVHVMKERSVPVKCATCNIPWNTGVHNDFYPEEEFIKRLRDLLFCVPAKRPMTIWLEMNGEVDL